MSWYRRDRAPEDSGVPHESVDRTRLIDGFITPAIIHNSGYYLTRLSVYADGLIDAWGLLDPPLFEGKVDSGWVVPKVPDGKTLSIHGLTSWTLEEGQWELTPKDLVTRATDLVRRLNPQMRNLHDCHGTTTEIIEGVRTAPGMSRPKATRPASERKLPPKLRGQHLYVVAEQDGVHYLSSLSVYQDNTFELGWLPRRTYIQRDELEQRFAKGRLRTEVDPGERITIFGVGSFSVAQVHYTTRVSDLLLEIDDVIDVLHRRPDSITRCRDSLDAYFATPTVANRERLRRAYYAVPEHQRMFVGDMDTKDVVVRMILEGDDAIKSWSHHAVAEARGEQTPTLRVPQPVDAAPSTLLLMSALGSVLSKAAQVPNKDEAARYHLADEGVTRDAAAAWLPKTNATALFLRAFAKMTSLFGEPDAAGLPHAHLGLQAVWEFDYYRWALWLAERSDDDAVVFVERC